MKGELTCWLARFTHVYIFLRGVFLENKEIDKKWENEWEKTQCNKFKFSILTNFKINESVFYWVDKYYNDLKELKFCQI